jgi:hypothetical protein
MQHLDPVNFDDDSIKVYYDNTIDWIFELFENSVLEDPSDLILSEEGTTVNRSRNDNRYRKEVALVDDDCDDQQIELYSLVKQRKQTENSTVATNQETVERKRKELRIKIKNSMEAYQKECINMDMLDYLDVNGNELFKMMEKQKLIDYKKILEWEDALYISKFFDATKWWKDHDSKYPELALAATIMLGKPTHNAFQERVFSRGTYSDTKLRKRLKEEYFEMSVMNAINGTMIDTMYEMVKPEMERLDLENENNTRQEVAEYLEKRQVEIDLTDVPDISTLHIIENEYGSITSQCTDDLSSLDENDDDGSIDDVLDYIVNDNNKNQTDETDGKMRAFSK